MRTRTLLATSILSVATFGLLAAGCTEPTSDTAAVAVDSDLAPLSDLPRSYPITPEPSQCSDPAMPEMLRLTNLVLTNHGAKSAFRYAADGTVSIKFPNPADSDALHRVRERYMKEMSAGANFDAAFRVFESRMQAIAAPAMLDSTCAGTFAYFALPILPTDTTTLENTRLFFRWAQHRYLKPKPCPTSFLQQQGVAYPPGTMCVFADPNWAGKDSNPLVVPQQFGGAPSYNWAGTTATPFTVTADPDTTFDPVTGATTVNLTVYRASGVPTYMTMGDTAAFRIDYAGIDQGVWKAQVVSTVATGSRATYLLKNRI